MPVPSPGDLPNPGIKLRSPTLQADSLPSEPQIFQCRASCFFFFFFSLNKAIRWKGKELQEWDTGVCVWKVGERAALNLERRGLTEPHCL